MLIFAQLSGLVWSLPALEAQTQYPRFQRLSPRQGSSSQGTVHSILQDSRGFMWFGTQDGLFRYDGVSFYPYRHDPRDVSSLSHNQVWALAEDHEGRLWIGTDAGGLNCWTSDTDSFEHYRHDPQNPQSLPDDRVRALLVDSEGLLWIGTERGLSSFDATNKTFHRFQHDPGDLYSLSDDRILALYEDRKSDFWVGTRGGLNRFDSKTRTFNRYLHDPTDPQSLGHDRVLSMYEDRQGRFWVSTFGGLDLLQQETKVFRHFRNDPAVPSSLCNDVVRTVLEDAAGRLWVATAGGLSRWQEETADFVNYSHDPLDLESLSSSDILTLYQDRGGVIWAGTLLGGITKWNPITLSFSHYKATASNPFGLTSNKVLSFAQDATGDAWIGTFGGGLNRWDRDAGRFIAYRHDPADPGSLSDDRVTALAVDREGFLWVGTRDGGLDLFDPAVGKVRHYAHDPADPTSLSSDEVVALFIDGAGTLWVGTFGNGLNRYDRRTDTFVHYLHDPQDSTTLSGDQVSCMAEGDDGELWIGTKDEGLNRLDRATGVFTRYLHDLADPTSLSNNVVLALYSDPAGVLWIGSKGGGLSRLTPEERAGGRRFRHYSERDGLPNAIVYGIEPDDQGHLWLSTNDGLARFDPVTEEFTTFDESNGLQSNEFNVGAHYRSPKGELFFGGINGFNVFFPDRIETNQHVPRIVLTALRDEDNKVMRFARPLYEMGRLERGYRENTFGFEFAALDYTDPEQNRYVYRLDGFDHGWIELEKLRPVTYTNLDPGMYVFRVKGANNDGVWNERGAALVIRIIPPPWRTWWAYCLYAVALTGISYGGVRWRLRGLERRSAELEALVAQRTAELSETVGQLQISERAALEAKKRALSAKNSAIKAREEALLERQKALHANRAKSAFLSNMSHELRTPLNAVLGFTQLMERDPDLPGEYREYLTNILRSGEHLLDLINDVLSLSKIEAGKLTLSEQPFDLPFLLRSVEGMMRAAAEAKGLALRCELPVDLPRCVRGDESRLRQVLINLLGNAVKFTARGRVELRVRWSEGQAEFEVADTGPGIAEDELGQLFEPFAQTRTGREAQEGTGLGLAICHQLVNLMNGEISVESEVDRGTTFRFKVPLAVADEAELPRERHHVIRLAPGHRSIRMLVVDDSAGNRTLLTRLLSKVGFEVREAVDGKGAVEQWVGWHPHLIWMDMRMPVMDGYEATRSIRHAESQLGTGHTVVIALTASAFDHDRREILAAGCDDVMTKPFRDTALFDKVAEHFDVDYVYGDSQAAASVSVATGAEPPSAPGNELWPRHILVAEDQVINQKVILRTLEHLGFQADLVRDGHEVLAALARKTYDLVLMDLEMPRLDGIEATRRLRRETSLGHQPRVVAMTAHATQEERERCFAAGMDDFLAKPVQIAELQAVLKGFSPDAAGRGAVVGKLPERGAAKPPGPIDRNRLARLRSFDDPAQEALASQIISLFLETAPSQLEDLQRAAAEGDGPQLRKLAHGLKGISSNLGALDVAAVCEELEGIGRLGFLPENEHRDKLDALLGRLGAELDRASAALEQELDRTPVH